MTQWSVEQANVWYARQPWPVGCNFIPSTAINQLEMWQAETFDAATIDRELAWAADLGFNTLRVFLHDLAWHVDSAGFKRRMGEYLAIAAHRGMRTMFVLFDDCWNSNPHAGPQPAPQPGVHNSGWFQSPGERIVCDPAQREWPRLEAYVHDVVSSFAQDDRILMWDVYNEPGNQGLGVKSLPLLRRAFEWTRAAQPGQPLTAGVWQTQPDLNPFQLAASDIITFHNYDAAQLLAEDMARLKTYGRPLICTEYMARPRGSHFATHLPVFLAQGVGCLSWGLVSGKTQTIYAWGTPLGNVTPAVWFHDIFYPDGTPYDAAEVAVLRSITREARTRWREGGEKTQDAG